MSTLHLIPGNIRRLYHVHEWRNATGILQTACPKEWRDIAQVLGRFRLYESEVRASGGNRGPVTRRLDGEFYRRKWVEKKFKTAIVVDQAWLDSPTHKVDCFKGGVALEIEWNSKDSVFDRDLNNFRLLFELRAIHVGVIVTRGADLNPIFRRLHKTMHASTTHLKKLVPKIDGGGGGGCPILVLAMRPALYVYGRPPPTQ